MHLPEPCIEMGTSGNALQKASKAKHHCREQRIKWVSIKQDINGYLTGITVSAEILHFWSRRAGAG